MICTQLKHERDLDSLFNCACSGKELALIALPILYGNETSYLVSPNTIRPNLYWYETSYLVSPDTIS